MSAFLNPNCHHLQTFLPLTTFLSYQFSYSIESIEDWHVACCKRELNYFYAFCLLWKAMVKVLWLDNLCNGSWNLIILCIDHSSRASSGKSTKEHRVDKDKEIRELNERLTNAQVLLDQSRRTNLSHEAEILQLQKEVSCMSCHGLSNSGARDWAQLANGLSRDGNGESFWYLTLDPRRKNQQKHPDARILTRLVLSPPNCLALGFLNNLTLCLFLSARWVKVRKWITDRKQSGARRKIREFGVITIWHCITWCQWITETEGTGNH